MKVSVYNSDIIKDVGFFLTVNQKYWEVSEEAKKNQSKKKVDNFKENYVIVDYLKNTGFMEILKHIHILQKDKVISWVGPYGETRVEVFESSFKRNI